MIRINECIATKKLIVYLKPTIHSQKGGKIKCCGCVCFHLRDPTLRKGIPLIITNSLLCKSNTILEWNPFPAIFHKVTNVLVAITFRISQDFPVVLAPKLQGGLLVHIGKSGVGKYLG
mmetsp:Transcript_25784/g.38317  ORF Transcript_25784/g.38317 Transcript_25784/m.38317 type:complete len:118 (-) Transcript_25784:487-840(-)